MRYRFPVEGVTIEVTDRKRGLSGNVWSDGLYSVSAGEFSMDTSDAGWFYAGGGNRVEVCPLPETPASSIETYLNGSVYGAILYQRGILPMHGSSFVYKGRGVIVCGDAGAGKSVLTAAFCHQGAQFLTDDVTPVIPRDGSPYIRALSDRFKLWRDTLDELHIDVKNLEKAFADSDKYLLPVNHTPGLHPVDHVILLSVTSCNDLQYETVNGAQRFEALRNEIYRPEYLRGMPGNEALFFDTIMTISSHAEVTRLRRPAMMRATELVRHVGAFFDNRAGIS